MMFSRAGLARNTLWNLFGQGVPLVVAIFSIPPLVHGLGTERFGVLTLVWLVIGYFSLFDLGIGRALTQLVAEKLGVGDTHRIPSLVWTAMVFMTGLGVVGAMIVGLISPWVVESGLKIHPDLYGEVLPAFYALAIAIPFVVGTTGLAGVLAAKQRFDIVNVLRIPMGLYTFLAPLVVLQFSPTLSHIAWALAAGRFVFLGLHIFACLRVLPGLRRPAIDISMVKPLFRFGAWMTVSNVVGPLMIYMDRFIIGVLLPMTAVAYYATPYEVVTRLWIVPTAIVAVLFPAFASLYATEPSRAASLCERGIRYILLLMFPATLIIVVFAKQGLLMWLGREFAEQGAVVLQWLAVGVFVNSICHVPFALIQGAGRPDITAKLHLLQVPFYFLLLWILLETRGIEGAAMAWTGRIFLDAVLLFIAVGLVLPEVKPAIWKISLYFVILLPTLAVAALADFLDFSGLFLASTLTLFFVLAWFYVLQTDERAGLTKYFKSQSAS